MNTTSLSPKHTFLALLTVVVWGINFIAIHVGLEAFPPFMLCAVRFALSAFPWVFFFPRPKAAIGPILGFGIATFVFQFGSLFWAISLGLSAGLASLLAQMQVFFSMGMAAFLFNDRPSNWKIMGSLISFAGIGMVAAHVGGETPLPGLILALMAAFFWSIGNMFTKKVDAQSPLALVVWGNLIALPFMVAISLVMEGPELIMASIPNVSMATVIALLYTAYISTHVGYGAWGFLLKTYSTAAVVPFTLLIPVVGFLSSALFLGETMTTWKLIASMLVMTGLIFNLLEQQIRALILKWGRRG